MSLVLTRCLGVKLEALEVGENCSKMDHCPKVLTGYTAEPESTLSWNVGKTLKKLNRLKKEKKK